MPFCCPTIIVPKEDPTGVFFVFSPKLQKHDREDEDSTALFRSEDEMAAEAAALRGYFE